MRKKLTQIALLLCGVAAIGAATAYWLSSSSNTQDYDGDRSVYIPRNASFEAVTDSLSRAGILKGNSSFALFGKLTGWSNQVKAGHYSV
ncbi:MAG: hypothetical protein HKN13_04125, partial [Rhodothermales bacterium]|nr:hypothetical protein [Rhodothermales bacterium]